MYRFTRALWGAALLAALALTAAAQEPAKQGDAAKKPAERPEVEVVFCLDTTGSMGGLIDAAKRKIWAICNQIAGGKPTPRLRVGLVGFRTASHFSTVFRRLTGSTPGAYRAALLRTNQARREGA